jgi:hypothetical protein
VAFCVRPVGNFGSDSRSEHICELSSLLWPRLDRRAVCFTQVDMGELAKGKERSQSD